MYDVNQYEHTFTLIQGNKKNENFKPHIFNYSIYKL